MSDFLVRSPDYAERVRLSFDKQAMMRTIGASLARVELGEIEVVLPIASQVCQQHGFVHAGAIATIADSACGYAALTLMPADAGILTVEFKINLLAPGEGERLVAIGRVARPGRTLTVTQAEVHAERAGERKLVALMTATVMTVEGRENVAD